VWYHSDSAYVCKIERDLQIFNSNICIIVALSRGRSSSKRRRRRLELCKVEHSDRSLEAEVFRKSLKRGNG
jgi:hypothetical protein